MKKIIVLFLLLAVPAFAQTPTSANRVPNMLGLTYGEHQWLILRGTALLDDPADSVSTAWFNFSTSDSSSGAENAEVIDQDADIMNLDISLATSGDSIGLAQIRVEFGWDDTGYLPIRNADSTFTIMLDGNYNLALYAGNGGYLYEDVPMMTTASTTWESFTWRYKIPVQGAAWCRITFVQHGAIQDNVTVTYTISMTHQ